MGSSREPRSKIPIVVAALSAVVLAILWLAIIQNIRGHQGKEPVSGSGRAGEEGKEPVPRENSRSGPVGGGLGDIPGSGRAGEKDKEPVSAGSGLADEERKEPVLSQPGPAIPAPVHPEDAALRPTVEPHAPHAAPEPGTRTEPARQSAVRPVTPPSRTKEAARFPTHKGLAPECMVELERLCPDTAGGVNRRACFQEKERHLSGACQSQLQAMAVRIKEGVMTFKYACETDIKRFCADVQPGGGRILQCLEDRYQEVSDPCYQTLRTKPFRK